MEGRERQRALRLQPLGAQHPYVAHRGQDLRQESGLSHARFPVHHDAAGRSVAGVVDERGQSRQLEVSPMQHAVTVPRAGAPGPPSYALQQTRHFDRVDRPGTQRQ